MTIKHSRYLKDVGAVFERIRVADIIDQADNVTGQIGIGQEVEVRKHFMKLRGKRQLLHKTIVSSSAVGIQSLSEYFTVNSTDTERATEVGEQHAAANVCAVDLHINMFP